MFAFCLVPRRKWEPEPTCRTDSSHYIIWMYRGGNERKSCWRRYRKVYVAKGKTERRNTINDTEDRCCMRSTGSVQNGSI